MLSRIHFIFDPFEILQVVGIMVRQVRKIKEDKVEFGASLE